MAGGIAIGTSSWADPGFVAGWYPEGLAARDRLGWYAEHFDAVEVNSAFYAVPAVAVEPLRRTGKRSTFVLQPSPWFKPRDHRLDELGEIGARAETLGEEAGEVRVMFHDNRGADAPVAAARLRELLGQDRAAAR